MNGPDANTSLRALQRRLTQTSQRRMIGIALPTHRGLHIVGYRRTSGPLDSSCKNYLLSQ